MTRFGKRNVTPSAALCATLCHVENWTEQKELWQRIRWARENAKFATAQAAAESLGIKAGTYRTYERPKESEGREPPIAELHRIARKFKVSFEWIAAGDGSPFEARLSADAQEVGGLVDRAPPEVIEAVKTLLGRTGTGG